MRKSKKRKELNSFLISFNSEALVIKLAPDEKAQLLDSLFDYAIRGNKADFSEDPLLDATFEFMTRHIDENNEKYVDKCLQNSANQKLRHLYDDFRKAKDRGLSTEQIEKAIRNISTEYEISIRQDINDQMGISPIAEQYA